MKKFLALLFILPVLAYGQTAPKRSAQLDELQSDTLRNFKDAQIYVPKRLKVDSLNYGVALPVGPAKDSNAVHRAAINKALDTNAVLRVDVNNARDTAAAAMVRLDNMHVVNARDFGAIAGDGINDRAALLQAVRYAYDNGYGQVQLQDGIYETDSTIALRGVINPAKSVSLIGNGWRTTRIVATRDNMDVVTLGVWASVEGVSISGGGYSGIVGVRFTSSYGRAENVNVDSCAIGLYLYGNTVDGGVYYNTAYNVRLNYSTVGIHIKSDPDLVVNSANSNAFYNMNVRNADYAVLIERGNGNFFYGGDIEGNDRGIWLVNGKANSFNGIWLESNTYGHLHIQYGDSVQSFTVVTNTGLENYVVEDSTSGSINSSSNLLTVASASYFIAGKNVRVSGAGAAGADLITYVDSVYGTTVRLADNASTSVSSASVIAPYYADAQSGEIASSRFRAFYGDVYLNRPIFGGPNRSSYSTTQFWGGAQLKANSSASKIFRLDLDGTTDLYLYNDDGDPVFRFIGSTKKFNLYGDAEAGLGSVGYKLIGSRSISSTQSGNSAGVETTIDSSSIPAGFMKETGDALAFYYSGTFASSSTDKQIKVKFGSTTIFDSGALTSITSSGSWVVTGEIVCTSGTAQKCNAVLTTSVAGVQKAGYATASATLSGAVPLVLTGVGTNANDVVKETRRVEYKPNP